MVGCGAESPSIVSELLDVAKHPAKPQYQMASEIPLILSGAGFADQPQLHLSPSAAELISRKIQKQRDDLSVRLALLHTVHTSVRQLQREAQTRAAPGANGAAAPNTALANGASGADGVTKQNGAARAGQSAKRREQQSKRERRTTGLRVGGVLHVPLLHRVREPTLPERLQAVRAKGLLPPVGREERAEADGLARMDADD